jgi:hypothetical protein
MSDIIYIHIYTYIFLPYLNNRVIHLCQRAGCHQVGCAVGPAGAVLSQVSETAAPVAGGVGAAEGSAGAGAPRQRGPARVSRAPGAEAGAGGGGGGGGG